MLRKFQKKLRASQTDAEERLWYYLRNRNFAGLKFRRQFILQNYIVDFICLEKNLVVELDGGQHDEQKAYDDRRTEKIARDGFKVIRFWNDDVLNNIEGVMETIEDAVKA